MVSLLAFSLIATSVPTYDWQSIVQPKLSDCVLEVQGVSGSQAELRKINKDFAASYRASYIKVYYKDPLKLRVESRVDGNDIYYVVNGGSKRFLVPKIHVGFTQSIAHAPGKRQTMLDFGILTPSSFDSLLKADFVRVDRDNGNLIFDLTYQADDRSRYRVWVDPQKRVLTKRVWFAQDGHEMATFSYENPREVGGVWFPTRAVVRNSDRKVAGITEYKNIQVNIGLSDSLFKT